jgi:predicted HAD superfamily Cof-like phosphohydrolase
MKGRLGRIAALATALALAVTGTVTVSNAAATQPASPQEGAVLVQDMHDALDQAADAGDVAKVKSTLTELEPLLTELESGERFAVTDSSRELADDAGVEAATTQDQVNRLFPEGEQKVDLPSVAELLNALVQRLLLSLSLLVNDLLGGVPVPA